VAEVPIEGVPEVPEVLFAALLGAPRLRQTWAAAPILCSLLALLESEPLLPDSDGASASASGQA